MTKSTAEENTRTGAQQSHDPNAGPYYMTEDILQDRLKKVNAGRFITQLYAAALASVSSISFGTVLGWSSPAIRSAMDRDFQGATSIDKSFDLAWVAALGPLGCALGVPVWSYFNIKLGPKSTMIIQSPLLLLVWALIVYSEETATETYKNYELEMAMRFFCGFFGISYRICGETLLTDTVHRYYLRRMLVPYRSCINLGVLITYVMGYSVSERYFAITNCVIVVVHLIMLILCPGSPVYLYDKNLKKAEKSLCWYRGKSNIFVDMRNIKKDSDIRKVDPAAYKYMLFSKVVIKAILIIILVNMAQVCSCYYIFLYYNPAIVKALSKMKIESIGEFQISDEDDFISRNVDALILGLNMFISHFTSAWIHFRFAIGIRKPLIISCSMVTVLLTLMAIYLFMVERQFVIVFHRNAWIYQAMVNLLVICFELGLSCCPDIMLMDYAPNQVFPRAKLIVKFTQWLAIFFLTKNIFRTYGLIYASGTFTIVAGLSLCMTIAICVFVVESKGKPLVQIQTEIGGNPVGSRGMYNKLTRSDDVAQAYRPDGV